MNQFKGTPGPWECEERYTGWVIKSSIYLSVPPIAYEIANGKDFGEHDAHLIAAALDLLEVVETFLSNYEGLKKVNNPEDSYALEVWGKLATAARAAISKALNQEV